jgi:hypothetical protein
MGSRSAEDEDHADGEDEVEKAGDCPPGRGVSRSADIDASR